MIRSDDVVEHVLRIHGRAEVVWEYWTDPLRVCEWWGSDAQLDPRPGGSCRIELGDGDVISGEYVDVAPFERIVLAVSDRSRLTVTLRGDGDHTVVTVTESGVPPNSLTHHDRRWAQWLPLLADAVGRDFRMDQST